MVLDVCSSLVDLTTRIAGVSCPTRLCESERKEANDLRVKLLSLALKVRSACLIERCGLLVFVVTDAFL